MTTILLVLLLSSTPAADLPMECLREKNRGQCMTCCKETEMTAKQCTRFCRFVKPPRPSEEVPQCR